MDDFVGAHAKPPQSKKKLSALQRSSQARQRMRSIREEATAPGAKTPLTLQVLSDPSYWAKIVRDNRPIDWANGERVGDPGKLSRHGRFPGHAGVIVTTSSTMKCCDGNCVRRWPLTSFGSYRPGPYPRKGVCVRDVCAIYDNNISPNLLMIIIKNYYPIFHTNQTH